MAMDAGTKLGRYEIRSKIGEGGMGEVYLAEDTRLHRKVALKVLPADLASNQDRMRRFEQEATAAAALSHPNIAQIFEIGEDHGKHFIAMEFVDGQTLRELIRGSEADLAKLLRYLQHAAEGLAKAHASGIVHRDLKPDNIMVTRDGHTKILAFGLAKLTEPRGDGETRRLGDEAETLIAASPSPHVSPSSTSPGLIMGTVGYMSPEQAQGRINEIDHRSDIFSFGCILYEAITRRKAFEGKDAIDSLNKIIREQPSPLSTFNPQVPYDLQKIVRRCLAKDPEDRYQTIKDVGIELRDLRRELQDRAGFDTAVPPPPVSTSQAALDSGSAHSSFAATSLSPTAPSTHPSSAEYIVRGIKQHRVAATIVTGVLVLAVGAVGIGLYKFIGGKKSVASLPSPKLQRLTTSGKASDAAISPDGKYVAHVKFDAGQQSLWLRQVATSSDTQIVPPSLEYYFGITFSKDGNYIYYVQGPPTNARSRTLYQVGTLGGASRKVIESVNSPVSLSQDGARLAFIRGSTASGETTLVVANADGTGERQVAVRKAPNLFSPGGPSWSPDGKLIACGVLNLDFARGAMSSVVEVPVEGGPERAITSQNWPPGAVQQVVWLADGTGLALIAFDLEKSSNQIWHISYPDGVARRITNDVNNYTRLSLTADSSVLVTVQTETAAGIWVAPQANATRANQISSGRYDGVQGLSWMPSGKILYSSR